MGKSYVENSLKRFLKRKVKITLGLVVAFMITGTVSLGAETEIKHEEHKNQVEWEQVAEAEKYLTSTKDKFEGNISGNYIKIENSGNKISYDIIKSLFNKNFTSTSITFEKEKISDETLKNIDSTLKILDTNFNQKFSDNEVKNIGIINNIDNTGYNEGINLIGQENVTITKGLIESGDVTVEKGKIGINIGTINNTQGNMYTPIDTTLYNYGVIKQGQGAAAAYNYGFLSQAASGKAQYVTKIGYNYGIIASTQNGQLTGKQFGKLYNYGIILSGSYSGDSGQSIGGFNTYAENNGIINAGAVGQSISNKARSKEEASNIVNKGTIFTKLSGQKIFGEGMYNASYNYGVISAVAENSTKTAVGQEITEKGENNKAFNFGKIIGDNGQKLSSQAGYGSSAYNYGTIETTSKGQYVAGMQADQTFSNDKVYNYGTINAGNGVGQYLEKSGEIYNFGIIKNDGTDYAVKVENAVDEKYKAENYGVIDLSSKDNGKAFSGNIINRGFVITQNGAVDNAWTGENKGVILKNDLTLGSTDKNQNVIDLSGKTGDIVLTDNKVTVGTNDLTDTDKTTVFMKNQNAQLTGTEYNNKNILAVVDDKNWNSSEAIIQAKDGTSLDLTNTVVTGYFAGEKGGTVLSTNSDLTLVGDTVISAVKGENVKEDVYALSLEKGTDGKSPMLTFVGNAQINGKINGKEGGISNVASHKFETTGGEIGKLQFRNANKEMLVAAGIKAEENYTNVTVGGGTDELIVNSLELSFRGTAKDKVNTVVLGENVKVTGDIDGTNSKSHEEDAKIPGLSAENKIDLTVNNLSNITGNITLGECDDKITVNNVEYSGTIDGNLGNDTLAVNPYTKTRADLENKLNYNIKNIETVELGAGDWTFGDKLNISSDNADKNVTVKTTGTLTSYIGKDYKGSLVNNGNADITVAGQDKDKQGTVKYLMGQGFAVKDSITLDDVKIGENAEAESVVIYDSKVGADGKTTLTLKSAEDMGIKDSTDKKAYEILLGAIEGNDNLRNEFNGFTKEEDVVNRIEKTEKSAKAYYTSGYVVTKNIADTYSSIAEDFSKKAGKGEWLAQGKYINSDTEFDGGSKVKGYDGDITGTVGMIEYGVSDQASYGAVFGMGDTEVDIDGGGKLDGDNSYIGAFVKYRTLNGIDLIGNIGFAKSDLDSKLSNEFTIDGVTGSSVEFFDGSADSKAITLSLIGKKDFHIADTVRLQPKAGVRYNFIQQEEAKNEGMGFRIAAQDVTIIEGLAGMGIVKDIDLNIGKLALNTGVEYTMSNASKYDEMEYTLYGSKLELENSEMADSRGLFYV
ncbi:MAG: autotransporter domain-containing protein, partial [Fusobacterium sp.]